MKYSFTRRPQEFEPFDILFHIESPQDARDLATLLKQSEVYGVDNITNTPTGHFLRQQAQTRLSLNLLRSAAQALLKRVPKDASVL